MTTTPDLIPEAPTTFGVGPGTNGDQPADDPGDAMDIESAGAEPPEPTITRAERDLTSAWEQVRDELTAKRHHRDMLNDEIRALVVHEDVLRRAAAVIVKAKPKS